MALEASRTYHALLGDLEAAPNFGIQEQAAEALRGRDDAIRALSEHESVHAKAKTRLSKAEAVGC
jgi:hypothetical protein